MFLRIQQAFLKIMSQQFTLFFNTMLDKLIKELLLIDFDQSMTLKILEARTQRCELDGKRYGFITR